MGAFRQKTVRQDGRIRAESCATFGKIVRHFPQSHRKINPCREDITYLNTHMFALGGIFLFVVIYIDRMFLFFSRTVLLKTYKWIV